MVRRWLKLSELCGAELRDGSNCGRPAGWGVPDDKDNPDNRCKDHLEGKNEELKKRFLEILQNEITTIKAAARKIGRAENTLWKWRQGDEEFDKAVREAKQNQRNMRAERVKDAVFKRIMDGEAAASTTIFWLKNNAGWQNNPETVVNVSQSQGQRSGGDVTERMREYFSGLKVERDDDK